MADKTKPSRRVFCTAGAAALALAWIPIQDAAALSFKKGGGVAPLLPVTNRDTRTITNTSGVTLATESFYSFGWACKLGDCPSGWQPVVILPNGTRLPTQSDRRSTWSGGSLLHTDITVYIPANSLPAGATTLTIAVINLPFDNVSAIVASDITSATDFKRLWTTLKDSSGVTQGSGSWTGSLNTAITASLPNGDSSVTHSGPLRKSWSCWTKIADNTGGALHAHLSTRFHVDAFRSPVTGQIVGFRCESINENGWINVAGADLFSYDDSWNNYSTVVRSYSNSQHYSHSGAGSFQTNGLADWFTLSEPPLTMQLPAAALLYLRSTRLIAPYDLSQTVSNSPAALKTYTPFTNGLMVKNWGTTGERDDIGLLPDWNVESLFQQSSATWLQNSRVTALACLSVPLHWKNEATGRIPTCIGSNQSGLGTDLVGAHWYTSSNNHNAVTPGGGSNAYGGWIGTGGSGWTNETSHMPSLAYYHYLIEGRIIFEEELCWLTNMGGFGLNYANGYRQKTISATTYYALMMGPDTNSTRGTAWQLRELNYAAAILPDTAPEKAYFSNVITSNMNYMTAYIPTLSAAGQAQGYMHNLTGAANSQDWKEFYQMSYIGAVAGLVTGMGYSAVSAFVNYVTQWNHGIVNNIPFFATAYYGQVKKSWLSTAWCTAFSEIGVELFGVDNSTPLAVNFTAATSLCTMDRTPSITVQNGDRVRFGTSLWIGSNSGPALPSGLGTDYTIFYYVVNYGVGGANTFQISLTLGGAPITGFVADATAVHAAWRPQYDDGGVFNSAGTHNGTSNVGYGNLILTYLNCQKAAGISGASAALAAFSPRLAIINPTGQPKYLMASAY